MPHFCLGILYEHDLLGMFGNIPLFELPACVETEGSFRYSQKAIM
jgi:hypothetical protein